MPGTDFDHLPIAWREAGAGDTIIFLHGLGGSRTSWEPQLDQLASQFRCVAWDMPGYGKSAPVAPLTFAAVADALDGLIDSLGISGAHLIGESLGGMHALHFAIRHPSRLKRMILTNSSPAFGVDGTDAETWKASRLARIDRGETPADIARDVYSEIAGPNLIGSKLDQRVASFARVTADGFRAAVECLPSHDVRHYLASISSTTLVMVGELDRETPPEYGETLVAGIPSSELVVVAGAGHIIAAEFPNMFCELVSDFLTREDL